MQTKFKFLLEIDKDGNAKMPLKELFTKVLTYFSRESNVLLTVEEIKTKRSLDQNAYYWGVVVPFVRSLYFEEGTILTEQQVHIELRIMFLKEETASLITGEMVSLIGSTADLSTKQFAEYIERIAQFVSEFFNAVLPPPEKKS